MSKSRDAFRTISEVADALDTPAHVLRFWESKFSQVKPVKRAGGRRYYRPGDMDLLAGIKQLLHDDGMTIKGAQKLMREQGVKHVAALGKSALAVDTPDADVIDAAPDPAPAPEPEQTPEPKQSPEPAPASEPEAPALKVDVTKVVHLTPPAPTGPAVSPTLSSKPEEPANPSPEPEPEPKPHVAEAAPAPAPDVPDDPADADSKLPPRLFHLLHKASHTGLAARAEAIAPLLDRMQVLRDRIDIR